ncbi:alpha/beta fold hydrolase [Bacteriovorax sp. DB6_IX]|uniref:alpha/beta fold hydrolase n=1 Tax=Bacteriovorax sp. DB6_IX TaxID=1353530 RepID=UPI000418D5CE|nr:alpha/beta hydrolase [Bacteriovorax sp. DB6_IX]
MKFHHTTKKMTDIIQRYGCASEGSKFLDLNGIRFHYREFGQREKPTLVLIHGIVDSLHTWELLISHLKDNYHLVTIDLPGFGLSDIIPIDDDMVKSIVDHLNDAFKELNLSKFHLVGNSLGGLIAWNYSFHYSESVDKLILLSPGAFYQKFPWIFDISHPLINKVIRKTGRFSLKHLIPLTGPMVPGLVYNFENLSYIRQQFRRIADLMTCEENFENYINILEAAYHYDFKDSLKIPEIQNEILLIHGRKDRVIPMEPQVQKWRRLIPGLKVLNPDDSAHMPQWEKPELLSREIKKFLSS